MKQYDVVDIKTQFDFSLLTTVDDKGIHMVMEDYAGRLRHWIIDAQEAGTRKGLIRLGWTPPGRVSLREALSLWWHRRRT